MATASPTVQSSSTATTLRATSTPPAPCRYFLDTDLAFVDTARGWALRPSEDQNKFATLYATTNGGETWHSLHIPQLSGGRCGDDSRLPRVSEVRFASPNDGWLIIPDYYVTHDGGASWWQESREVWSFEIKDGTIWSIEGTCLALEACALVLQSSSDNGLTWQPPIKLPSRVGPLGLTLIRGTVRDAWILSGHGELEPSLIATHDSGKSWEQLIDPCPRWRHTIAAVDAQELWLVCSGIGATIMEDKQVYVSLDAGVHWELKADSCYQYCKLNNIDSVGHVLDMFAPAPQRAFIALGRSTLIGTKDGSRTWSHAIEFSKGSGADSGVLRVLFVDVLHGWAVGGARRLFRTSNGGAYWDDFPAPGQP